jgi:hypothetical protein
VLRRFVKVRVVAILRVKFDDEGMERRLRGATRFRDARDQAAAPTAFRHLVRFFQVQSYSVLISSDLKCLDLEQRLHSAA